MRITRDKIILYSVYAFVIIVMAFIASLRPVQSATLEDANTLFKEGKVVCTIHAQKCTFRVIDNRLLIAYSTYDDITLSTGIVKYLTMDELRGVFYHELAHSVLNHSEQGQKYYDHFVSYYKRQPKSEDLQIYRYSKEREADIYASKMLGLARFPNKLGDALIKITTENGTSGASDTHPAVADRIKDINVQKWIFRN